MLKTVENNILKSIVVIRYSLYITKLFNFKQFCKASFLLKIKERKREIEREQERERGGEEGKARDNVNICFKCNFERKNDNCMFIFVL